MTRTSIIDHLGEITIAPITTTIRDIPSEVFLDKAEGLKRDCAVNLDHIQTVSRNKVGSRITELCAGRMAEVGRAVAFALDL